MKTIFIAAMLAPTLGQAADPAAGQALFANCTACHAVTTPAGQVLVPGGATGPDQFGVVGRSAGSLPGYGYSAGLMALNAAGHVWEDASLAAFIANPNAFLADRLGLGHTSKMPFGRRDGARDIVAWLTQVR